jgi:RHS repeat-associated protein
VLTLTDPDSGKTTYSYDAAQHVMTVTDARGKTTSYTYDADGRKTGEYDTTGGAGENSSDEIAAWTYDTVAKGQLTSSTSYSGGAQYIEEVTGYAANGQPSGIETVIPASQGALAGTYTQSYTYAPSGQETSYTDSAAGGLPAETVTTGYDNAGNPNSLTGTSLYVDSLSYTNLGQPQQYTMGTSGEPVYITDSYDPQTGNLTQQDTETGTAQTSVDDLNYTYNDVGDITSEADTPSGATSATDVQCFQYDYLGRLVQAWAQGTTGCASTPSASAEGGAAPYWESYAYNAIGNLTGITSTTQSGAVTTTADTYPAAGAAQPHAITGQSVTTPSGTSTSNYGYNAGGQLTTVAGTTADQALTWNDAGQLTQDALTPAGGGTAQDTSYIYDANGNLLMRTDPGSTTLLLADEELVLNTSTGIVTGTRLYSMGDMMVAARTGAASLAYVVGDQQNTEEVAIDSGTLAVTRRYFDPYGNTLGSAPASWPGGQKGFAGGTADPSASTGLTDMGAREYQAATASFISPDPIRNAFDPQDLNAYAYSYDDPATYSDPTGQTPCVPGVSCKTSPLPKSAPPTVSLVTHEGQQCLEVNGKIYACLPVAPCGGGISPQLATWFLNAGLALTYDLKKIGWQGALTVLNFSICLLPDVGPLACMIVSDANTIVDKLPGILTTGLTRSQIDNLAVSLASNAAGVAIGSYADEIYDNIVTPLQEDVGTVFKSPLYKTVYNYIVGVEQTSANCNGENDPQNLIGLCKNG